MLSSHNQNMGHNMNFSYKDYTINDAYFYENFSHHCDKAFTTKETIGFGARFYHFIATLGVSIPALIGQIIAVFDKVIVRRFTSPEIKPQTDPKPDPIKTPIIEVDPPETPTLEQTPEADPEPAPEPEEVVKPKHTWSFKDYLTPKNIIIGSLGVTALILVGNYILTGKAPQPPVPPHLNDFNFTGEQFSCPAIDTGISKAPYSAPVTNNLEYFKCPKIDISTTTPICETIDGNPYLDAIVEKAKSIFSNVTNSCPAFAPYGTSPACDGSLYIDPVANTNFNSTTIIENVLGVLPNNSNVTNVTDTFLKSVANTNITNTSIIENPLDILPNSSNVTKPGFTDIPLGDRVLDFTEWGYSKFEAAKQWIATCGNDTSTACISAKGYKDDAVELASENPKTSMGLYGTFVGGVSYLFGPVAGAAVSTATGMADNYWCNGTTTTTLIKDYPVLRNINSGLQELYKSAVLAIPFAAYAKNAYSKKNRSNFNDAALTVQDYLNKYDNTLNMYSAGKLINAIHRKDVLLDDQIINNFQKSLNVDDADKKIFNNALSFVKKNKHLLDQLYDANDKLVIPVADDTQQGYISLTKNILQNAFTLSTTYFITPFMKNNYGFKPSGHVMTTAVVLGAANGLIKSTENEWAQRGISLAASVVNVVSTIFLMNTPNPAHHSIPEIVAGAVIAYEIHKFSTAISECEWLQKKLHII